MPKSVNDLTSTYIDVSDRALLLVTGADAQDLLHRISSNDLSNLATGASVTTVFTTEKGRIVDVPTILKLSAGRLLLASQHVSTKEIQNWIERFIISDDVQCNTMQVEMRHLLFFGSNDFVKLQQSTELARPISTSEEDTFLGIFNEEWSGNTVHHVIGPTPAIDAMLHHMEGVEKATSKEFEEFRIRRRIPIYPNELNESFNPHEAGLRNLISFTKGCYVGQEVIARLETYHKVQRALVSLELSDPIGTTPEVLTDGHQEVGVVTSASGKYALGYVRLLAVKEQTRLFVGIGDRSTTATIKREIKLDG